MFLAIQWGTDKAVMPKQIDDGCQSACHCCHNEHGKMALQWHWLTLLSVPKLPSLLRHFGQNCMHANILISSIAQSTQKTQTDVKRLNVQICRDLKFQFFNWMIGLNTLALDNDTVLPDLHSMGDWAFPDANPRSETSFLADFITVTITDNNLM